MLKLVYFNLFSHLAVGTFLAMLLVPSQRIGAGFFRFTAWLGAGVLVAALIAQPFAGSWFDAFSMAGGTFQGVGAQRTFLLYLTLVVMAAVTARVPEQYLQAAVKATALVALAALVSDTMRYSPEGMTGVAYQATAVVSNVASCMMLGTVLAGLVLGQWSVVEPDISIDPLRRMTWGYIGAIALRAVMLVALLVYLYNADGGRFSTDVDTLFRLAENGTIFFARFGFGIVGPGVLAYLIWDTVRYMSTQSAAGILYVAIFLVLIGEVFAKFMFLTTGILV